MEVVRLGITGAGIEMVDTGFYPGLYVVDAGACIPAGLPIERLVQTIKI